MAKRAGGFGLGQSGYRIKYVSFKRVKNEFGSNGLRVGLGKVDPNFSHDFFKRKHVFTI